MQVSNASNPAPRERESVAPLGILLRLTQGYFAGIIIVGCSYAAFSRGEGFAYDISLLRAFVQIGGATCAVWLLERRAKVSRVFVAVLCVFSVALVLADFLESEPLDGVASNTPLGLVEFVVAVEILVYLSVALFVLTSAHAKEVLSIKLDWYHISAFVPSHKTSAPAAETQSAPTFGERRFSWPWWRNLAIYYMTFSIVGHWAEIAFCQLIVLGVVMGDYDYSNTMLWEMWLYPFPAEGVAVVLIVVCLYPLKEWLTRKLPGKTPLVLFLSFLANGIVCTSIDFTLGITANADYALWDYSEMPFNFMGQICLQNSLVYTTAATIIVWVVYPLMERALNRIPTMFVNALFFAGAAFYVFLWLLYYVQITPAGIAIG